MGSGQDGGEVKRKNQGDSTTDARAGSFCEQCGVVITEKVSNYSVKRFGTSLCMRCQKAQVA